MGLEATTRKQTHQSKEGSWPRVIYQSNMIAAWEIWKLRKAKVFDRGDPSHVRWLSLFLKQCSDHLVRFKTDL
jgi:hypothetical protein